MPVEVALCCSGFVTHSAESVSDRTLLEQQHLPNSIMSCVSSDSALSPQGLLLAHLLRQLLISKTCTIGAHALCTSTKHQEEAVEAGQEKQCGVRAKQGCAAQASSHEVRAAARCWASEGAVCSAGQVTVQADEHSQPCKAAQAARGAVTRCPPRRCRSGAAAAGRARR